MVKNSAIAFLVFGFIISITMFFFRGEAGEQRVSPSGQNTSFEPVVVLELFTSQGCSSCPAADRLLHQLVMNNQEPVYAIAYHVDYWNYIGWEDPFSKAEFTSRQRVYNNKLNNSSNYTPQLVINGREHMVGSNTEKIKNRINFYRGVRASNAIEVSGLQKTGHTLLANYTVSGELTGRQLRVILLLDERSTYVKRGENRDRTLLNGQIALTVRELPLNDPGGQLQLSIPDLVGKGDGLHLLFLTENEVQDITGATQLKVPK